MNRSILTTALAGLVLACSVSVGFARDNDRGWDGDGDRRYRNGDRNHSQNNNRYGGYRDENRNGGGYGYGNNDRYRGSGVIDRTMSDLRQVASRNRVDGHERDHIRDAMSDLQRLRSQFDDSRLRSAIENLSHLANADQIRPNDRRMLARNINDLRGLRYNGDYRY